MAKSLCFFNHKGSVSKTTTTFNVAWGLADLGYKVLIVDLDPQCNLTDIVFGQDSLSDETIENFYSSRNNLTIKPVVDFIINGGQPSNFFNADQGKLYISKHKNLHLLPGHIDISEMDSQISVSLRISRGVPSMKNIPGNLPELLNKIARQNSIDYILYDLSPNIGGLNQVILMSSDYFAVPASPDFFCWQAISSISKVITNWHKDINRFIEDNNFGKDYSLTNSPKFIGLIQQRYRPRDGRAVQSFEIWIDKIRREVNKQLVPELKKINCIVDDKEFENVIKDTDLQPYDLAHIPDFNSLIAISQNLSKPIYALSDEEIACYGKSFGHALQTMKNSRDAFVLTFKELTKRIETLTK